MSKAKSKSKATRQDLVEISRELGIEATDEQLELAMESDDPEIWLQSLVPAGDDLSEVPEDQPQAATPAAAELPVIATRLLELPLGVVPCGYVSRHVDARLDRRQGAALRRLQDGLDRAGRRLANGKRVISTADAVRWLLEQIDPKASE